MSLCLINWPSHHEDEWGSGGIAPPFLTSTLDGGELSASHSRRFTSGKGLPYPLSRRLGGPHSRSGCCEGANNFLPLLGIELSPSSPYPEAIPNDLNIDDKRELTPLSAKNIISVRVRVTLRLATYRRSVHLGVKPLETHDQHFFSTERLRS
jgi:hypothetical protein